jgi:hypothetical protein
VIAAPGSAAFQETETGTDSGLLISSPRPAPPQSRAAATVEVTVAECLEELAE